MVKVGPGLQVRLTEPVRAAVNAVGRTEDLRFSPGNRLLAIAGFENDSVLILRVAIEDTSDGIAVSADDYIEVTSGFLHSPHGLDFIDDETLVVASRGGGVAILQLPPGEPSGRSCEIAASLHLPGGRLRRIWTPGSVAVRHELDGLVSILVCNNYAHRVTRHVVDPQDGYRVVHNEVLLRRGLDIPDGIALSHDGRWIAVSSHATHDVKLFSTSEKIGPRTEPAGALVGANYPHGIQFSGDDRYLLAADAGSRVVNVYERGGGWEGERMPVRSVVVLDEETFARGRHNIEEGGPKGIAIDASGRVVAITNEAQPLAFHSLRSITGAG